MKKISYKVNRAASGGPRKARGKIQKVRSLNITSLIDILTILLVFLIKNVSLDAERLTVPDQMALPSSIVAEELEKSGRSVVLKVFTDQILLGSENMYVGTPDDFMTDTDVRNQLLQFMREQSAQIVAQNPDSLPLLLIQADETIQCRYITDIVALGADADFANIYFSTVRGDDPQLLYGS
jgi:biopolymer transport protein ExbD